MNTTQNISYVFLSYDLDKFLSWGRFLIESFAEISSYSGISIPEKRFILAGGHPP